MTYRRYRSGKPWRRAGAPAALVLVGLVAAVAVARAGDPVHGAQASAGGPRLIANGVTIGGVPVGGFTPRQAASATNDVFAERLVLTTDTKILAVHPAKLGARPLTADAVAGARRAAPGENVRLVVDVDQARLRSYVNALDRRYSRPARDARVLLSGVRPVVKKEREGLAVQRRTLEKELTAALAAGDRTPLRIPFKRLRPSVSSSDFKSVIVIQRGSNHLVVWDGKRRWASFGVATGQPIYPTPLGAFSIVTMQQNPWWNPPDSDWARGLSPVPPGPGNPLGTRWMGLSAPGVGIHGTPDAASIGYSASHGCIRMRIPDAERLFDHVTVGTPVFIVSA